jgi:hypothetical protein
MVVIARALDGEIVLISPAKVPCRSSCPERLMAPVPLSSVQRRDVGGDRCRQLTRESDNDEHRIRHNDRKESSDVLRPNRIVRLIRHRRYSDGHAVVTEPTGVRSRFFPAESK